MDAKKCFKCSRLLPLCDFYVHEQMKDGRLGKCKDCTRADVTRNRDARIDEARAYDRARGNRQGPEYLREYRKRNKEKDRAHRLLNYAVRTGKITKKPCEVCGDKRTQGHHDNYEAVYDVRWLCSKHHRQHHHGRKID